MAKLPKILEMIYEKVQEEIDNEVRPPRERGIFRASELGDCPRYLQYTFMDKEKERISPSLALLFADGHLHHNAIRGLLRRAGSVSNEENGFSKKYLVPLDERVIPIILTATCDGVFDGEYVIDVKSINFFSFKNLTEESLETNYPHYIDQLQAYLEVLDKQWGALLFKDKMTSAMKIFWYERSLARLNKALKRMAQIEFALEQGKMIKRPYTKSSTECKRCPMRKHCWGVPMERRN